MTCWVRPAVASASRLDRIAHDWRPILATLLPLLGSGCGNETGSAPQREQPRRQAATTYPPGSFLEDGKLPDRSVIAFAEEQDTGEHAVEFLEAREPCDPEFYTNSFARVESGIEKRVWLLNDGRHVLWVSSSEPWEVGSSVVVHVRRVEGLLEIESAGLLSRSDFKSSWCPALTGSVGIGAIPDESASRVLLEFDLSSRALARVVRGQGCVTFDLDRPEYYGRRLLAPIGLPFPTPGELDRQRPPESR